jgi:hypothetical protein
MKASAIIYYLLKSGYTGTFVRSQDPQLEDDSIDIVGHPNVDIQLCQDGTASVTKRLGDGTFICYENTRNHDQLIKDVQDACLIEYFCFVCNPIKGELAIKKPNILAQSIAAAKKIAIQLYGVGCIVHENEYSPS